MTVELLHHTPLWVASTAIRKCWASEDKSDTDYEAIRCPLCGGWYETNEDTECEYCGSSNYYPEVKIGPKDRDLIERVGNKNKHSSTLEHLNYSFDIDGISRACLQELARHRHASLSVKSTRYTLKELKEKDYTELYSFMEYLVDTGDDFINNQNCERLMGICDMMYNIPTTNDKLKYMLPEAYKTSLVWTINARALQNFLSLRTDKSALWEIQDLAREIFKQLPEEHKYLFEDYVKEYE